MRTFISRSAWKSIMWFALFFACFFTASAVSQYFFVRSQLYTSTVKRLDRWADQIARAIYSQDHWTFQSYFNAYYEAPLTYYVVTQDGLLIDVEGFIPGLISQTRWAYAAFYRHPINVTTEVGEPWRIYGKQLKGGSVIIGISYPNQTPNPDKLLTDNLEAFGATLDQALKISPRAIDSSIDYAVVDDFGNLRYAFGQIPLRTDPRFLPNTASTIEKIEHLADKEYLILFKPIAKSGGTTAGWVIFYTDLSQLFHALRSQAVFNLLIGAASWLLVVTLAGVLFVTNELRRRQDQVTLEEALRRGEGQAIEFKRGIVDDVLAREIAAFANTNAGNIFIGVDDGGTVIGLQNLTSKSRDLLLQKIRNITTQTIKPALLPLASFVAHGPATVLHIFVPRGNQPLYFVDGVVYVRHLDSAVKARPEEVEAIIRKFYR